MKYLESQTSIEKYIAANWPGAIAFENEPFDSDAYNEYLEITIQFGESVKRSIEHCYKIIGLLIISINVRPAVGAARALTIANALSPLLASHELVATPPDSAPVVQFVVPTLDKVLRERRGGWSQMQLSCPFYYFYFQ